MEETLMRYRRGAIVLTHAAVFGFSLWLSFLLRLDFVLPESQAANLMDTLPVFIAIKLIVFGVLRQYAGWWRYVSLDDLLSVVRAALVAAPVLAAAVYLLGVRGFPRSVIALDVVVTIAMLSGLRIGIRMFRERWFRRGHRDILLTRALVVGTGPTAEGFLREAGRSPELGIRVVGIISDDPTHVGTRVATTPILGTVEDIAERVRKLECSQVIIALEGGNGDLVRRVVAQCSSADIKHRVLPPTEAMMQGRVSVSNLREVSLQDLLGRPPARLNLEQIAQLLSGETVLVTGAGGSIGSELCRQIARFGTGRILLLEQAENPLFHLERELAQSFPDVRVEPIVADVYDGARLRNLFEEYRPRFVLHAAAHKHVPLMEQNPSEAIKNNIIGTLNVIRASQAANVDRVVLISTDKAVNPTSVMGASKRVAEMLMQSLANEGPTVLAAVRFGNVLGSNGSVIPIFQQQIAAGGPVTITHPEMRRYFMTIPEATQLVLQAATYSKGGEVFVLDMGEPVYIVDVARDLIRLSGLRPDEDIQIQFSGMRPGEKLFEELATDQEETSRTQHDRIFVSAAAPPAADAVLAAARHLESLAQQQVPPQEIRRRLFLLLGALESGDSIEAVLQQATGPQNVLRLQDRGGVVGQARA